ncbi:MAG TPA: PorP/SprF family type IX secretion system membrane protein [Chitinophagales bacterium]|nr:PorP/SprF family type IX secretion system membrane protein [Chitinophagales bacterium]
MRLFTPLAKFTLIAAIVVATFQANAQDIHFSQFNTQTSTLNPALVGNYDGSYRVAAIYRNQWTSALAKYGYQTVGADVDFCLLEGYLKTDKLAIGVGFFNDRSGAAGYTNTSATITLAYHKGFGAEGQHRLSVALQGGFLQTRIEDPLFGDQFNGYNQTPSLSSSEAFTHGVYKFDFNAGVYWRSNFKDLVRLGLGFGAYHLITPDLGMVTQQSSTSTSTVLPRRFDADVNVEVMLGKAHKFSLSPDFLFMYQQPFMEYLPGLSATYYFNTGFRNNNSVSLGLRYRSGGGTSDAIIPMANVEFRNVRLGFSYDANISGLSVSTNNRGAFEVSLVYVGETIKSFKANKSLPSRRF